MSAAVLSAPILPFKQRLAYRQAKFVLLVTFLLGIVVGLMQISLDYYNTQNDASSNARQIINIVKSSAIQAVYDIDTELGMEVVSGLMKYHLIQQATLIFGQDEVLAEQSRQSTASQYRWISNWLFNQNQHYKISLQDEEGIHLGYLEIHIDPHQLGLGFANRVIIIFLSGLGRNFFLALILLYFFHHIVTKPLSQLTQNLACIDPQHPEKTRLTSPRYHKNDELGQMVDITNVLLTTLEQRAIERDKLNIELEQRVVQRTEELEQANREITNLNARLQQENVRMSAELEVTRQLQQMVLPNIEELQGIKEFDIAGFMQPADEVGGDYYDVIQHQDGRIVFGIGDVTGHGLESGVIMLMVQTAVHTLLNYGVRDPEVFLKVLNKTIYANVQRIQSEKTMTLCLLDYQNNTLRYSGQHEYILVVRQDGKVECIDTVDLGFWVGMDVNTEAFFTRAQTDLVTGDGIVLYTDGITEAINPFEEEYGLERLCQLVSQHWTKPAIKIQQIIVNDVYEYTQGTVLSDDLTLLILKKM